MHIEAVVSGEIIVTPFAGPRVLRCAADAAAGVAGRLSSDIAGRLLAALDQRLWTAPVILEALIPGRMQSHASTAEVPRGAA